MNSFQPPISNIQFPTGEELAQTWTLAISRGSGAAIGDLWLFQLAIGYSPAPAGRRLDIDSYVFSTADYSIKPVRRPAHPECFFSTDYARYLHRQI